jgi:alpha-L-fucosidase
MKISFTTALLTLATATAAAPTLTRAQEMDKMWGDQELTSTSTANQPARRGRFFDSGNYAMFVHWGLYSAIGNKWEGKNYYGISEWIMNPGMADIPADKYTALAKDFNPSKFDAKKLAQLAKDAGMKYIIITSKHHDGFAMYHSKANPFNIVDATPFKRDPMKELSEECKKLGLGLGFYYSHNQDWTFPGGGNGPKTDPSGTKKTFDDYFAEKCLPQVEEITKNYGDIELIWFDTPGRMPRKYAKQLADVVHRNQPNALVSGRVGFGLGDYRTFGDMEVPLQNVPGLWEGVDVTNDSWGYAWYDNNWKTPTQILGYLVATVARGGTYMLNVGPDATGQVPEPAQAALRAAGKWIATYPQVIYNAQPSPWKHALPWGDVVINNGKLYLVVFKWPTTGKLHLPGLDAEVTAANLLGENGKATPLTWEKDATWTTINTPFQRPENLLNGNLPSVIEVSTKAAGKVDNTQAIDPEFGAHLSVVFSKTENCSVHKKKWMEKFGEWKHVPQIGDWKTDAKATWEFDIKAPGRYLVELTFSAIGAAVGSDPRSAGGSPRVWRVESDEGKVLQNRQNSSEIYRTRPIGWISFDKPGRHSLTISLPELPTAPSPTAPSPTASSSTASTAAGPPPSTSLSSLTLTPGTF